jgi:hypothetical protein
MATRAGNTGELLAFAARKSGRSSFQIGRDFAQLNKSATRINAVEYVRWKLYDENRHSPEERAAFLSNDLHWPIAHACNDEGWNKAAEDKMLAGTILSAGGVPVPETVAVIDRGTRRYPGVAKIETADALRDLLLAHADTPLFGKIVDGMVSFGAFRVESADRTHITCSGRDPMTYDAFLSEFVGDKAYMLQHRLDNHADLHPYAGAVATVRMVNLLTDQGLHTPMAAIKLPQGGNIADAFWRPGNLACEVDPRSGGIRSVVRRDGPEMTFLPDHPDTPGLLGLVLPHWDAVKDINERAACLYAPIRYQSTDIAITADGPVVVELNYGGGFDLPQNVSGRGLLTPETRAFFAQFGFDFAAAESKKKSGGLGLFARRA